METRDAINLLRSKTDLAPAVLRIEKQLVDTSYWIVGGVLVIALATSAVFLFYKQQVAARVVEEAALTRRVEQAKQSENVYVALKDRARIVRSVMNVQRPWTQALDTVSAFASPSQIGGLSFDEQGKVQLTLKAPTLDEMLPVIATLVQQQQDGRVRAATLTSFTVSKDGAVQIGVAFIPLF